MTYTGYSTRERYVAYFEYIRVLCCFGHRCCCCTALIFGWRNKSRDDKRATKWYYIVWSSSACLSPLVHGFVCRGTFHILRELWTSFRQIRILQKQDSKGELSALMVLQMHLTLSWVCCGGCKYETCLPQYHSIGCPASARSRV